MQFFGKCTGYYRSNLSFLPRFASGETQQTFLVSRLKTLREVLPKNAFYLVRFRVYQKPLTFLSSNDIFRYISFPVYLCSRTVRSLCNHKKQCIQPLEVRA